MINKDKNNVLQITISKTDSAKLDEIQTHLSAFLNIDLTKSQTIAFLIRNYSTKPSAKPTTTETPKQAPKGVSSGVNYSAQIKALKDKLGVSFTRLGEILGIPPSTLKKYASGTQQPKAENEQIIKTALANYGIK